MTLRSYQQLLAVNTLYAIQASDAGNGASLTPFLEVIGGTANVYGTTVQPASAPTGMTLSNGSPLQGILPFQSLPNYLYITQASGSITSIVLSGVVATPVV